MRPLLVLVLAQLISLATATQFVHIYVNQTVARSSGEGLSVRQNANHLIADLINALVISNLQTLQLIAHYVDDYRLADVFVNLADEHSAEMVATNIWPHVQGDHCFVRSQSYHLSIQRSMRRQTKWGDGIYTYLPIAITGGYHALVLRFRLRCGGFESVTRGMVYSIQMHTGSSMPNLERYPHDKFYFLGVYVYHFVAMFIFLTFFSARCTVPDFIPLPDPAPLELTDLRFGYGRICLRELLAARYQHRSCMLPCSELAVAETQDVDDTQPPPMHVSAEYVSFDRVLKVASHSAHAAAITDRLQRFAQAGMCKKLFEDQQRRSYAHLRESRAEPPMRIGDIVEFVYVTFASLAVAIGVFGLELLVGRVRRRGAMN